MHFFIDHTQLIEQNIADSFGVNSSNPNLFKITTEFQLTAKAQTFACQDGMIIVQQSNSDSSLVNVILKPTKGLNIQFSSVKYYVYRGISKDSFFINDQIIPKSQVPENSFLKRIWKDIEEFRINFNLPNYPDPVPKDFGYDETLSNTIEIEKLFDNSQSVTFPIYIKEGEWIGNFGNSKKIGFEIILETNNLEIPSFNNQINLEYLRKENHTIDVSSLSGFEKRAKQELVLSYIDPCAFFGLHYDIGVDVSVFSGNTKSIQNKKQDELYNQLLNKFKNKNKIYLDIRNENGYSYNFYQSYKDSNSKNIKIENSPSEYGTDSWPILILDSPNKSKINLNLRIDDNLKPILFSENRELFEKQNNSCFIDDTKLLNENATDWSENILLNFPTIQIGNTNKNVAYYAKLYYFQQENKSFLRRNITAENQSIPDAVFASLDTPYLGSSDYTFQQVSNPNYSFLKGNLPSGEDFSGAVLAGANFDENRVVFHTRMTFPNETTGDFYLSTNAGINEGFNLEGNFNQMSFLKRDIYCYTQSIQESLDTDLVKVLDVSTFNGYPGRKEDLFLLGITQSELSTLKNVTGLSNKHARYIRFEDVSPDPEVDINGISFRKYKLNVQGLDNNGDIAMVYPTTEIFVYTNSGCVFSSKNFADAELDKEDNIEYIYYTKVGYYLGGNVNSNKVYLSTQQEYDTVKQSQKWFVINKEKNLLKANSKPISYLKLVNLSATCYGECSLEYNVNNNVDIKRELLAIAYVHFHHPENVAYGANSNGAISFKNKKPAERNNKPMQLAIEASINAYTNGFDFSYGADSWDGIDVLTGGSWNNWKPENHYRQRGSGKYKGISDLQNISPVFYATAKKALEDKIASLADNNPLKKDYKAKYAHLQPLKVYVENENYKPLFKVVATYAVSIFYKTLK